jgi:hypothetical protein
MVSVTLFLLVKKHMLLLQRVLKNPGTNMCLWMQRVCGFGIADYQTQRMPVVGYVRE